MKDTLKKIVAVALAVMFIPLISRAFVPKREQKVTLYCEDRGKKISVNLKEYVIGALACEMPASFSLEALKAQSCAIFTNAIRSSAAGEEYVNRVSEKNLSGYTTKKILKEKWGNNFENYYSKLESAVDSTFGMVIACDNSPILAAYHSMSSGKTESAENVWGKKVSYLVPVESEGDTFCADLESEKTVSVDAAREIFKTALPDTFLPQVDSLLITDIKKSDSGTVLSAVVGDKELSGQKIRSLFSLRSACFDVTIENGNVTFKTYGYGHGVGLSQYGADFMARQGKSFAEILNHYYPSTTLMYIAQ